MTSVLVRVRYDFQVDYVESVGNEAAGTTNSVASKCESEFLRRRGGRRSGTDDKREGESGEVVWRVLYTGAPVSSSI